MMETTVTQAWCWLAPGAPSSLQLQELALPEPDAGEVIVRNDFAALNPVDWKLVAAGHAAWIPPHVPGVDGMGVISKVGSGVTRLQPGTRVCYHTDLRSHGSFARHTLVKARAVIPIPDSLPGHAAVALPCPGLTAWQALSKLPDLAGRDIVICGAGGAVGLFATQLALARNSRVHAIAGAAHHPQLTALGVASCCDYRDPDWKNQLSRNLQGRGAFAIIDMINSDHATTMLEWVSYAGHLVSVQDRVNPNPIPPFTRCLSLHEVALGATHQFGSDRDWANLVSAGRHMLEAISLGTMIPPKLEFAEFLNLPAALEKLKSGGTTAKFVIRIQDSPPGVPPFTPDHG